MLDTKEEQQYEQLRKLARELHIPIPEAFIELEVRDKHGNVIQRHRQRSHSWTRNAYNWMFSQLAGAGADDASFGAGNLNAKDTDGTIRQGATPIGFDVRYSMAAVITGKIYSGDGYRMVAGLEAGIVVGSGTNAEGFEDCALQTLITQGTGAGQLSYIESELGSVSYADTTLKNTLVRYFNNNSDGNVDVNEVALYPHLSVGAEHNFWVMVCRDKLASTVTVPVTGQLKVTYTISLTYPS